MIFALIVIVLLAALISAYAYKKGDGSHVKGFTIAKNTFINIAPLLFMAFIMAGFMRVVIPPELIESWLGEKAGLKGIFIGSIGGALIPGGPYVSFPVIASIYKAGAGLGAAVAFVTGWAMWGVINIPFELALIGSRFMFIRLALVLVIPPLSGLMANLFFG